MLFYTGTHRFVHTRCSRRQWYWVHAWSLIAYKNMTALFSSRKRLFQTGKNYIKVVLLGKHSITLSEITHLTIDSTGPPAYIVRVENIITFTELGWRSCVDRVWNHAQQLCLYQGSTTGFPSDVRYRELTICFPCYIWQPTLHQPSTHCGPNAAIWRCTTERTLAQCMVCYRTSPYHYLNQCWLRIGGAQWQSPLGDLTSDATAINDWKELEYYSFKIWFKYRRCQCVKQWMAGKFGISRNTVFLHKYTHILRFFIHWGRDKMAAIA